MRNIDNTKLYEQFMERVPASATMQQTNFEEFCKVNIDKQPTHNCNLYIRITRGKKELVYQLDIRNGSGREKLMMCDENYKKTSVVDYVDTYVELVKFVSIQRMLVTMSWFIEESENEPSSHHYIQKLKGIDSTLDLMRQPLYSTELRGEGHVSKTVEELEGLIGMTLCQEEITEEDMENIHYSRSHFGANKPLELYLYTTNFAHHYTKLFYVDQLNEIQMTTQLSNLPMEFDTNLNLKEKGLVGFKKIETYEVLTETENPTLEDYYARKYKTALLQFTDMLLLEYMESRTQRN